MAKIYDNSGWVNWDYILSQGAAFTAVVGARGVGKTYGLLKKLILEKRRFIYLRRLKSQLDLCSQTEGNPFKKLNNDLSIEILPKSSSGVLTFRDPDEQIVAVGVALSVVANVRGIDYSDYDFIVFDEFIANIGERPIKNEFDVFLNFYETVNRNREIEGRDPVKCVMLGNANTLINPYFSAWKFMKTAVNMITGNQMFWRSSDGSRIIIMLLQSPISKLKSQTVLYRNASDDFMSMALDNSFRTDETHVKSEPLQEYKHIVTVGEIGIYKHKSNRKYYVSATTGSDPYYDSYGIGLKMFQTDFYMLRVYYLINKIVWFESFELEVIFRNIFDLK